MRRRLVGLSRFLGLHRHASLVVGLNRDGLVIDESSLCSRVCVGQIERISGELAAAGAVALDEVGIVVSCDNFQSKSLEFQYGSAELTHNLPDEVCGHVGRGRHLVQAWVNGFVVARTFDRKLISSVSCAHFGWSGLALSVWGQAQVAPQAPRAKKSASPVTSKYHY